MDRNEFKHHACRTYGRSMRGSIMGETEPFWSPEFRDGWKASFFIECKVIYNSRWESTLRSDFWSWNKTNLSKVPLCFMCDSINDKEWWGFNTEQDAVLFLMKWLG